MCNQACEFDEAKFLVDLYNSDDDYTFNGLNDLINFMHTVDKLDNVISNDSLTIFIDLILGRLNDVNESPNLANPIFKIIILFAQKLPLKLLRNVFNQLFEEIIKEESTILSQINSVLREILSNSITFETERQKEIIECLFPKLELEIKQSGNGDISLFYMDIFAVLLENLGKLLTNEQIADIYELVKAKLNVINNQNENTISSLIKVSTLLFSKEQNDSLLNLVLKIENDEFKITVLNAMITYKPSLYKEKASKLIMVLSDWIEKENIKLTESQSKELSPEKLIQSISNLLLSISFLICKIPNISHEEVTELTKMCFKFLIYDANMDYYNELNQDNEFNEDEVLDDSDLDDIDDLDEGIGESDSWKIRKNSIYLAKVLVKYYPDQFYDILIFQDENINNFLSVDILIHDSDLGVQKDAIQFLEVLIDNYKETLGQDNMEYLIGSIISQFKPEKSEIFNVALNTLSSIITKIDQIHSNLIIQALQHLTPIVKDAFIPSLLNFIQVVMSVFNDSELIEPIGLLLVRLFNYQKIKSKIPLLNVLANLFKYSNGIMKDVIEELLEIIIHMTKEDGEKAIKSIYLLSIFIASFPDSPLLEKSINVIIECLNMSIKTSIDSLALIAASPSRNILQKHLNVIFNLLSQQLSSLDRAIAYHSLWAIRIFIEFKLLGENSINQGLISSLLQIISNDDNESNLLIFEIFSIISHVTINNLVDLEKIILNQYFPEEIIEIFLKFLSNCYMIDQNLVNDFISTLLEEGSNSQNIDNISRIVGFAGYLNIDFGVTLLNKFEEQILKKNKIVPYEILCIGELGSHFDISNHDELINKLFELVKSPNRNVFSAASKCIGLISICSIDNVLNKILDFTEKCNEQVTLYISSILSFANRKTNLTIEKSKQILNCLYKIADYNKETSDQIAKVFSVLLQYHNEFIDDFLNLIKENQKLAPVALNGISLYVENTNNDTSGLIEKIILFIDPKKPVLSKYGMYCVKIWLNQPNMAQKLVNYFSIICECVKTYPEHTTLFYYGASPVNVDIGYYLRLYAIESANLYLKYVPELIDQKSIVEVSLISIKDNNDEIKLKGYQLISNYSLYYFNKPHDNELIYSLVHDVIYLEPEVFAKHSEELEQSYLCSIIYLRKLTEKQKISELEQFYTRHQQDNKIQKLELDSQPLFNTDSFSSFAQININTVSYTLLNKFYPPAATIFS